MIQRLVTAYFFAVFNGWVDTSDDHLFRMIKYSNERRNMFFIVRVSKHSSQFILDVFQLLAVVDKTNFNCSKNIRSAQSNPEIRLSNKTM